MDSCCSGSTERPNRTCMRKALFLAINSILIVWGVIIIIIGSVALSNLSKIDTDNIKPLMDTITVDAIQPLGAVKYVCSLFIVVGVLIIFAIPLVVVVFVCGDGRIRLYLLIMVTSFIVMLISWETSVIVQWSISKDKVENELKSKMILALDHFKADATTNSNSISNAWNFLFMKLNCCGVNAVLTTTNDFDSTPWCTTSGSCQATSSQIPKTCCLNVDENTYTSAPSGCHASVNSGTYNEQGCFDALKETLLTFYTAVLGVVCTTIILEIVAVVIGYVFFRMPSVDSL